MYPWQTLCTQMKYLFNQLKIFVLDDKAVCLAPY